MGLIFGIKGIQIEKMQEKQMQPIDFSHISTTNKLFICIFATQ